MATLGNSGRNCTLRSEFAEFRRNSLQLWVTRGGIPPSGIDFLVFLFRCEVSEFAASCCHLRQIYFQFRRNQQQVVTSSRKTRQNFILLFVASPRHPCARHWKSVTRVHAAAHVRAHARARLLAMGPAVHTRARPAHRRARLCNPRTPPCTALHVPCTPPCTVLASGPCTARLKATEVRGLQHCAPLPSPTPITAGGLFHMYACMYVRMHTCMYACMYAYMYVHGINFLVPGGTPGNFG